MVKIAHIDSEGLDNLGRLETLCEGFPADVIELQVQNVKVPEHRSRVVYLPGLHILADTVNNVVSF